MSNAFIDYDSSTGNIVISGYDSTADDLHVFVFDTSLNEVNQMELTILTGTMTAVYDMKCEAGFIYIYANPAPGTFNGVTLFKIKANLSTTTTA